MDTIITLAAWAAVAIRVLPEVIRSRRTYVSVKVTPRGEAGRELSIVATNVEDAVQVVRQALAAQPEEQRRICRSRAGLLPRRGCESRCPPADPTPPLSPGQ
ncbi:hypothetical protein [Nocardia heshunensis]